MRIRLPLLLLTTAVTLAFHGLAIQATESPLTVAVFDFTANFNPVTAKDVTALVTANLSTDPRIALVERAQLTKALREQALGMSGNVDFGAAAKVGQLTGAKVLISGRAMKLRGELVIVANLIGTETSRIQTEKVQGSPTNLLDLTSNLCQQIVRTISTQGSNFIGAASFSRQKLTEELHSLTKGKQLPSISVEIPEKVAGERGLHRTAQHELAALLQAAGFEILNNKSDRRPDIEITGNAVADGGEKTGNLFAARASLEVQLQERRSGKLILIDHAQSAISDIGHQTATRLALEKAADDIVGRVVTALVQAQAAAR